MVAKTDVRSFEASNPLKVMDPIWDSLREEARAAAEKDPVLAAFLYSTVINHRSLEECVIHRICERLDHPDMQATLLRQVFDKMVEDWPEWSDILRVDIQAVYDRDPACLRFMEAVLYFKGFHALQTHRLAHWLLNQGRRDLALYLQSRSSSVFQTDINPAARIGRGIFLDHATGLVVGETAVIGDNVSILHGVTLGGTGKEGADRHPKIGSGVLIGAGAKILGNIQIGYCSRVAAGSVVLQPVPPKTTVAGVPAKVVGEAGCSEPSRIMDQVIGAGI
ncbi:serine O-acetyltransferase [Rhizobium sullae]|uniref:Serine acetyltransferase n=1 Tax=Rhizobium sullae TaxID=50338 RepID=A0A2N0D0S7_RHISU|nr:serine O-acetyltransferase [Rhizobium sullae]PKA39721.1 serine O-acetyltransferase [Rhizobium sullae]TCU13161.1 serine O-acetyltransferase [Rhizobium sullae]UWU16148.1 serine O-acetyltransferase [Rhizobium sullae]